MWWKSCCDRFGMLVLMAICSSLFPVCFSGVFQSYRASVPADVHRWRSSSLYRNAGINPSRCDGKGTFSIDFHKYLHKDPNQNLCCCKKNLSMSCWCDIFMLLHMMNEPCGKERLFGSTLFCCFQTYFSLHSSSPAYVQLVHGGSSPDPPPNNGSESSGFSSTCLQLFH